MSGGNLSATTSTVAVDDIWFPCVFALPEYPQSALLDQLGSWSLPIPPVSLEYLPLLISDSEITGRIAPSKSIFAWVQGATFKFIIDKRRTRVSRNRNIDILSFQVNDRIKDNRLGIRCCVWDFIQPIRSRFFFS